MEVDDPSDYKFSIAYWYETGEYESYAFKHFGELEHDIIKSKRSRNATGLVNHTIFFSPDANLTSAQQQRLSELRVY